jgi:hypothetical protein
MWHYNLIQEIIMNNKWIEENGDNWVAGRVECVYSEREYWLTKTEYLLIIDKKDWNKFDDYLIGLNTDSLQSLDQLIQSSRLPIIQFGIKGEKL